MSDTLYASSIVDVSSASSEARVERTLGAPNNLKWCSNNARGKEFIELEFPMAVHIRGINLWGLEYSGFEVTEVCVRHNTGKYTTVYEKSSNAKTATYSNPFKILTKEVYGNRVRVSLEQEGSYEYYLDAIEIIKSAYGGNNGEGDNQGDCQLYLSSSLDLINGLHEEFNGADDNIKDNSPVRPSMYKTVIVNKGTWILYDHPNFNDTVPKQGKQMKVGLGTHLLELEGKPFIPKSLRPINVNPNTLTLFEHRDYGGKMKSYSTEQSVLSDFPAYDVGGVSSMIIQPSQPWEFFTEQGFKGCSFILRPGDYPRKRSFNHLDDCIQSVRKAAI